MRPVDGKVNFVQERFPDYSRKVKKVQANTECIDAPNACYPVVDFDIMKGELVPVHAVYLCEQCNSRRACAVSRGLILARDKIKMDTRFFILLIWFSAISGLSGYGI